MLCRSCARSRVTSHHTRRLRTHTTLFRSIGDSACRSAPAGAYVYFCPSGQQRTREQEPTQEGKRHRSRLDRLGLGRKQLRHRMYCRARHDLKIPGYETNIAHPVGCAKYHTVRSPKQSNSALFGVAREASTNHTNPREDRFVPIRYRGCLRFHA